MPSIRLPQRPAFSLLHPSFLVISTYQLDSEAASRSGALHFLSPQLEPIHVLPTPAGVFRFHFPRPDVCVSALTDGSIYTTALSDFSSEAVSVTDNLLLDVSCSDSSALCSDNKGQLHLVDTMTSAVVSTWTGHKLPFTGDPCEVWTCCLSEFGACSGGEDALLRLWDTRSASSVGVAKLFDAGVTFTKWTDEHTLLTGSYDQKIRIIDVRNMKQATKEIETAGGVWHIDRSCFSGTVRHLAACMYGGWTLFDDQFDVLCSNEAAGQQLLYGATLLSPTSIALSTFNDYTVAVADIQPL